MPAPLNAVAVAGPRNGTNSHTVSPASGTVVAGTAFTPTAGRFLVCIVEGSVTSTTPSGWTLPSGGSAVNNTGLYVWYRTAAGSDTIATTHNGSNYPIIVHFLEFAAGSTWVGAQAATAQAIGSSQTITGLTGTNNLYGVVGGAAANTTTAHAWTWSAGTKLVDTNVPYIGGSTDGYTYSITQVVDSTAASQVFSTSGSTATAGPPNYEKIAFAVAQPTGATIAMAGDASAASVATGTSAIGAKIAQTGTGSATSAGTGASALTKFATASGSYTAFNQVAMTGTGSATSSAAGASVILRPSAGTGSATSSATGASTAAVASSGAATAVSTASGASALSTAHSGDAQAASAASAISAALRPSSGSATANSTATGTTQVQSDNSGSASGSSVATGALLVRRALAGTASATSTATGALDLEDGSEGTASATSSATGTLQVARALAGTATALSSATAETHVSRTLTGSAVAASTATAIAYAAVIMAGQATAATSATGTLAVVNPANLRDIVVEVFATLGNHRVRATTGRYDATAAPAPYRVTAGV